jgi:hypothetical protein
MKTYRVCYLLFFRGRDNQQRSTVITAQSDEYARLFAREYMEGVRKLESAWRAELGLVEIMST